MTSRLRTRKTELANRSSSSTEESATSESGSTIAEFLDAVVVTRAGVERSAEPDDLARVIAPLVPTIDVVPDPAQALARARERCGPDGFVLVAGSLYLVGEILGLLEGRPVPGPVPL